MYWLCAHADYHLCSIPLSLLIQQNFILFLNPDTLLKSSLQVKLHSNHAGENKSEYFNVQLDNLLLKFQPQNKTLNLNFNQTPRLAIFNFLRNPYKCSHKNHHNLQPSNGPIRAKQITQSSSMIGQHFYQQSFSS